MRRGPTLAILGGAGLLLAAVYGEVPAWLGMTGVVLLFVAGGWAMRRTSVDRRETFFGYTDGGAPSTLGDFSHGHHHGSGHHSGFDGGSVFGGDGGGGFFDGGGSFGGDGGGGGGGD